MLAAATGMKWIEVKMKELGVSSHSAYKLCFMMDSSAMISVHTPKYGVIEVGVVSKVFFLVVCRINLYPNKPLFLCVCSTSLLKTLWEKEKFLLVSNFSFSHSIFYPSGELAANFLKYKIVVCKLFEFGRV